MREFVVVIRVYRTEVLRTEPLDITRARIAIAEWKQENRNKRNVEIWMETMSQPGHERSQMLLKRRHDLSEQEKIVNKYL